MTHDTDVEPAADSPTKAPISRRPHRRCSFRYELEKLINCHSMESGSDTPDFILSKYLADCLNAFDDATNARTNWYVDRIEEAP